MAKERVYGNQDKFRKEQKKVRQERFERQGRQEHSEWQERPDRQGRRIEKKKSKLCPVSHRCGGCQYLDMAYEEQL